MGVTLDLFSTRRIYRGTVVQNVSELIHDERAWTLSADIPSERRVKNGEYVGMWCVDDRYRLFEVEDAKNDDARATTRLTATDAAIGDLQGTIVKKIAIENANIETAVNSVMNGLGWNVNIQTETDDKEDVKAYFSSAWDVLSGIADSFNVRIIPHYTIGNGMLIGKTLDVTDKKNEYRGRLVEQGHDASSVVVQYIGKNQPMIYALGATKSSGDPPEKVTIAGIEWSIAKGDPADKPKGQEWIAVPEALATMPEGEERGQTAEWPGITDPKKLIERAWEKAQKAAQPEMMASATISDMEMIAGQRWKAIRMWDSVCVQPKNGEPAMLQVIGIKRNYVRPGRTNITLGTDEETGMDDLVRQVAALSRMSSSTSSTVRSHGVGIKNNLTHLEDLDIQVDEVKTEISRVWIDLDAANAKIELAATKEELTNVSKTVTEVKIELDAMDAELTLRVKKDEIAATLNITPQEVKIQASKIDLSGYVTASRFSSEIADINSLLSGQATIRKISCTEIKLNGYSLYRKPVTVDGTTHNLIAYAIGD